MEYYLKKKINIRRFIYILLDTFQFWKFTCSIYSNHHESKYNTVNVLYLDIIILRTLIFVHCGKHFNFNEKNPLSSWRQQ